MMLGVWFTFGPDTPCLWESVASFREACGAGAKVAIVDDQKAPVSAEALKGVGADLHRRTDFDRGRNLRGWECVLGMLKVMQEACDELGVEGCVKIDSDTLVFDVDWIEEEAPLCGFMPGRHAHALGMAYWIRREAMRRAHESLSTRWRKEGWAAPEDQTISAELLWRYGSQCVLHEWGTKWAGGWQYGKVPLKRYQECKVVTFGDRRLIHGCRCSNEQREAAAVAMGKFRRWKRQASRL